MSHTQNLSTAQETIGSQEYPTYKRQLLTLRRQYAELIHANRFEKTEAYAGKLKELEVEIARIEKLLARAPVIAPESAPITLGEIAGILVDSLIVFKNDLIALGAIVKRWMRKHVVQRLELDDTKTVEDKLA